MRPGRLYPALPRGVLTRGSLDLCAERPQEGARPPEASISCPQWLMRRDLGQAMGAIRCKSRWW